MLLVHSGDDGANYDQEYFLNGRGKKGIVPQTILKVEGGVFDGNQASTAGGALYIQSNSQADITAGKFVNNAVTTASAPWSGGAIYVQGDYGQTGGPGVLNLNNALITNNHADGQGGGLALCPSGNGYIGYADGATIYGNTRSGGERGDVHVAALGNGQIVSLSNMALGGVANKWNGNKEEDPSFITKGDINYRNDLTEADRVAASAPATVVFENNSTKTNGGVISNNGIVNIGEQVASLYIKKVDATSKAGLNGAEFSLVGENYNKTITTVRAKSNDGIASFHDLIPGEYTLTETKAPAGYADHQLSWKVAVDKDYKISVTTKDGKSILPSGEWSETNGKIFDVYEFDNTKEPPAIEKYVNQAVHKDVYFDEVFTYDILAYIPNGATQFKITDFLHQKKFL